MFIVHRRGLVLDGSHPTELYGYGGFGISITPSFPRHGLHGWKWVESSRRRTSVEAENMASGILQEHEAETKRLRRLHCRRRMVDCQWIYLQFKARNQGGSNGGLLVGACLNQRPELFGAAVPAVGVMDMLRFHKFTIGWSWVSDYGSPDNPEDFKCFWPIPRIHSIKRESSIQRL